MREVCDISQTVQETAPSLLGSQVLARLDPLEPPNAHVHTLLLMFCHFLIPHFHLQSP